MVKNNTTGYATKEDAIYMTIRIRFSDWRYILYMIVSIIAGAFLLRFLMPWWIAVLIYGQRFSAEDMLILIFGAGVGLFGIVYPFISLYRLAMKVYHEEVSYKEKMSVEIAFEEEGIVKRMSSKTYSNETHIDYSCVEGYLARKNVVYIKFILNQSPSYFILYDDAYIEGSREELIRFLEERNIKRLKK